MFKSIQLVRRGDTVKSTFLDDKGRLTVERGVGVKVGKIEHNACSSKGTHINSRECYDSTALVWVERAALDDDRPEYDPSMRWIEMQNYPLGQIASIAQTAEGLQMEGITFNGDPMAAKLLQEIFAK